jgi:Na+-transporting methylmalonyl-CoA/oxaloacetate decarboxylase gamma subunit
VTEPVSSSTGITSPTTNETTTQTPAQTTQPEKARTTYSTEPASSSSSKLPLIIGLVLLFLLLLGLLIYFLSRKFGSSTNRVIAATKKDDEEKPKANNLANYAAVQPKQRTTPYADRPVKRETENSLTIHPTGPLLLNLFVEDQNTNIGKRNIHSLKSGYSLSVGGGNSDFLIFLVEVPSNIGELRRNASQLTFIPRKQKYFPDLGSNELRDCLNKTIRIISDRNYEIRFRFEMYEDPLDTMNRMLNRIKVPG